MHVTPQATLHLVGEQAVVRPGDRVALALHHDLAPHWHTYWRNPGDSGEALAADWQLPGGAAVSALQWPVPERIAYGTLVTYGYTGAATLLADVSVPADWPQGAPFPVAVEVYFLVCADICIPAEAALDLAVPTGSRTVPSAEHAALFAAARTAMPETGPGPAAVAVQEDRLRLVVRSGKTEIGPATGAYFFADTWGIADHGAAQNVAWSGGEMTVHVPRGQAAPGKRITGVLAVTRDGEGLPSRRGFRIDAPVVSESVPNP